MQNIRIGNLMIDCADAAALRDFYAELLNWSPVTLYGMPGVRGPEGFCYLFAQEEDYVPPVWPEEPGSQQKQLHVDYQVPDLAEAVAQAEALGADSGKVIVIDDVIMNKGPCMKELNSSRSGKCFHFITTYSFTCKQQ